MRFENRFTELFSARSSGDRTDGSYGSGFLLGRGVILTARHVIVPPRWGGVPPVLDISARPVGLASARGWLSATLLWPAHQDLAQEGPDVALVRLNEVPAEASDDGTMVLGLESEDEGADAHDYAWEVLAVGFPNFTRVRPEGDQRDTDQVSGIVKPFAALVSKTYKIDNIEFSSRTDKPQTTTSDWEGFSGAPLIVPRRLIGVVTTTQKGGSFDFRAVRLDQFSKNPDFLAAINGAAVMSDAAAKVEAPQLESLVCLLDRDDQESDFIEAHKRSCSAIQAGQQQTSVRPMICLLPGAGEYRHAGELMADRLSLKTLPDLAWAPNTTKFQWLGWPPARLDPVSALARLRGALWNALCGGGEAPEKAEEYRTLWKDRSRSRLFLTDLTDIPLNAHTAEVLAAWSTFFAQLVPSDRQPPAHLLLLAATSDEVSAWREQVRTASEVEIELLTELAQCNPTHLTRWFTERLPPAAQMQKRIIEQIQPTLSKEFSNKFFMRELWARVGQLVQEKSNG